MTNAMTITAPVNFGRAPNGRRRLSAGEQVTVPAPAVGRVPRIARLMALALRFEGLLRSGVVRDYRELADLGHVTRARISQIMTLLNLGPDLQEMLLFLPRTERGRAPIILRDVLPIATTIEWPKQRRLWQRLLSHGRS
jgi:hypothetical protein